MFALHSRHMAGFIVAMLAAGAGAAMAADAAGRYSMSPADGGFVRLDTQTGLMSLCQKAGTDWSCADMAESADSVRKRLNELEAENKALKDDVKRMEETFGLAEGAPGKPGEPTPKITMPSEQDVDKAFDYLEGMIKKFRERMKKLEDQQGSEGTPL
jgi:hypothetical protein